jgi:phosphatidylglycerophosphatase A
MSQPDEKNAGADFTPPSSQLTPEGVRKIVPTKPVSKLAIWTATGFGLGYLPIAPGTWGSLGGVVLALAAANSFNLWSLVVGRIANVPPREAFWPALFFWPFFHLFCAGLVGIVGVWASRHAMRHFGKPDPGPVVIDEISGQLITYLPALASSFAPGGWKYLLLGFILFRGFDIVKPWPCKQAERWPHGWGIMADDWFAGLYAAAILWMVQRLGWLG